ncbi:response regulator [Streptomyces sp. NPDC051561]|uniref:response regulator n=1 Tax=Streptomyces sp. NPDC051561 TaxID=3365658 RepID=UPI0037926A04
MTAVTVMIIDDDKLLRYGLQQILESAADIQVSAVCDGRDAVEMATRHSPDIALVDIRMPDVNGFDVLTELGKLDKPPTVAMLTGFGSDEDVARALSAGAAGFFLKDASPHELIPGVRLLAAGGSALSAVVARSLANNHAQAAAGRHRSSVSAPEEAASGTLTPKERNVLGLLPTGMSNSEIAQQLSMSRSTVKDHVSSILAKLGVSNRVQAAMAAHRGAPPADVATRHAASAVQTSRT